MENRVRKKYIFQKYIKNILQYINIFIIIGKDLYQYIYHYLQRPLKIYCNIFFPNPGTKTKANDDDKQRNRRLATS